MKLILQSAAYIVSVVVAVLLFVALLSLAGCGDGHEFTVGIITGGAFCCVLVVALVVDQQMLNHYELERDKLRARAPSNPEPGK